MRLARRDRAAPAREERHGGVRSVTEGNAAGARRWPSALPPPRRGPLRERADAGDGGGDRGTAGREPQREMTILEVLARLMVCGTNGKGAIGAKAYLTVTTTVLPG